MADYISREAAKQILSILLVKDAAECACNLIDSVLPADVEPVRYGRWGKKQGGFWEFAACSLCGEKTPTVGIMPNFCPNCGAKMELEDETNDDKGLCNPGESDFCSYGQAPINSTPVNQEERWLKTV